MKVSKSTVLIQDENTQSIFLMMAKEMHFQLDFTIDH